MTISSISFLLNFPFLSKITYFLHIDFYKDTCFRATFPPLNWPKLPIFPIHPSSSHLFFRFSMSITIPSISSPSPSSNISSSSSPSAAAANYIGADELCPREHHRVHYCNLHNSAHLCICYTPVELLRKSTPLCSRLLRLDSLEYLVLTISVSFPVPASFRFDPDSIFAEDLELFTGFRRSRVFILRKGCAPDRRAFQFQFGILHPAITNGSSPHAPLSLVETDLRLIHPRMFTRNLNFMRQKGLMIGRVEQTKFLRPLIGFPDWVHRERLAVRGLGLCRLRDPHRCYAAEMSLLALIGVWAGAECARTIFWQIFRMRHGRRERGRRRGRRSEDEEEEGWEEVNG